jgi:hypothetical protein
MPIRPYSNIRAISMAICCSLAGMAHSTGMDRVLPVNGDADGIGMNMLGHD